MCAFSENSKIHFLTRIGVSLKSLVIFSICAAHSILAQANSSTMPSSSGAPLIVNIDNPNFRKLVAATPKFFTKANANFGATQLAQAGAAELSRLLSFSGLFSIVGENAYAEIYKKIEEESKKIGSVLEKESNLNLSTWKTSGIESLTVAEVVQEGKNYSIALKTFDTNRSQLLLGKKYSNLQESEISKVMRRYADLILETYTGKPGIFNSKLVFVGKASHRSYKQIYVSNFDGSEAVAITNTPAPHLSPQWSKDGRYITYTSFELGTADVFLYDVAKKTHRRLSTSKGIDSGATWAPNHQIIALTGSVDGDTDIYSILPQGGGTRNLVIKGSGVDVDPAFSPDGKYLAFVSGRFQNPHIFRASLVWDSPSKFRVTEDKRLTYAGWWNAMPSWSPDSQKIAFAGFDKEINRFDLFMMNHDGTKLERLTLKMGDNEHPTWSPNGQLIAFHSNRVEGSSAKGLNQLYVMNRDGSGQRKLETGLYEAYTPSWSVPF